MHSKTKGDKNVRGRNPKIVLYDAASADYAKRMAQWEEEHAKKLKKENTQMLSNMIAGMTTSCTNIYTTKYAINDIASIKYHLSCNPNCDSAIYDKVAKLQSQEGILQQKYLEFQQKQKRQLHSPNQHKQRCQHFQPRPCRISRIRRHL